MCRRLDSRLDSFVLEKPETFEKKLKPPESNLQIFDNFSYLLSLFKSRLSLVVLFLLPCGILGNYYH